MGRGRGGRDGSDAGALRSSLGSPSASVDEFDQVEIQDVNKNIDEVLAHENSMSLRHYLIEGLDPRLTADKETVDKTLDEYLIACQSRKEDFTEHPHSEILSYFLSRRFITRGLFDRDSSYTPPTSGAGADYDRLVRDYKIDWVGKNVDTDEVSAAGLDPEEFKKALGYSDFEPLAISNSLKEKLFSGKEYRAEDLDLKEVVFPELLEQQRDEMFERIKNLKATVNNPESVTADTMKEFEAVSRDTTSPMSVRWPSDLQKEIDARKENLELQRYVEESEGTNEVVDALVQKNVKRNEYVAPTLYSVSKLINEPVEKNYPNS